MNKKKTLMGVTIGWQIVVLLLYGGGIAVDVFQMLGISWNLLGWRKLIGSLATLSLLELPAMVGLVFLIDSRNR